ncbi:ShlB/FhaC/HecB family hemolysin secretion/activation protein, partial [bacterium]|nr:ShlB/FhaC/HecB family hemolysin secretion/activation protein [bacterium]
MAATPTTGDILRQVEPVKMPETPKALPSVGAGEYKAPLSAKDDVKTFVKSFKFSGNSAFTSEALSELVKPYEGKDLGINALKEVASIITKYYRDNGYFVARAYIPAQSMENGIVEITIIEGTYGAFDMKNTSLVDTAEVQGYMDYLKGGELVSTMSLERQMLIINDLSGAQVTNAEVYPGAEVGT